jgi:HSP20 family protein|tara:strand:- start:367 stop:858 length:492 start_codon:yes stop_codon:yes gene_type:complete
MRIKDIMPWSHHTGESHHQPDKADARHSLKQDINALVDRFVEKVGSFELPWHDTEAKSDVVQADKAVEISIELPGMGLEDIDLSISGDMLVVQGEKKIERREEKQGYFLSERAYGQIYRAIPLPPGLDVDAAVADLKNGVLTVRIPQSAEAAASVKKIDIKKS